MIMARFGFLMRLKNEDCIEEYERLHVDIGDDMREVHRKCGIRNYSIYRKGLDLLGYLEADDPQSTFDRLEKEPLIHQWWAKTNQLMETDERNRPKVTPLKEIFHMD
jgi:L-rhamnose mutarotase